MTCGEKLKLFFVTLLCIALLQFKTVYAATSEKTDTFEIIMVTYNIKCLPGPLLKKDSEQRVLSITNKLDEINPDIIAFQEVFDAVFNMAE